MATLPNGKKPDLVFDIPELMVGVWSSAPEFDGKPTQVHLIIDVPELGALVTRLKSRGAIDYVISELIRARDQVWGPADASPK